MLQASDVPKQIHQKRLHISDTETRKRRGQRTWGKKKRKSERRTRFSFRGKLRQDVCMVCTEKEAKRDVRNVKWKRGSQRVLLLRRGVTETGLPYAQSTTHTHTHTPLRAPVQSGAALFRFLPRRSRAQHSFRFSLFSFPEGVKTKENTRTHRLLTGRVFPRERAPPKNAKPVVAQSGARATTKANDTTKKKKFPE